MAPERPLSTFSTVMGNSRTRTPVALKIALAITAPDPLTPISPTPLTPKAFETLHTLLRHSGRIVSKEQLLQAVWPDSFVEENNLTVAISSLRKALGERPRGAQYIETVQRLGYRFIGDLRVGESLARPRRAGPLKFLMWRASS